MFRKISCTSPLPLRSSKRHRGHRYEYYHAYPCLVNEGKVYYSTIKKDAPQYYGCDFPRQVEFDAKQIKYYYAEAFTYIDYTYDEATCLMKGLIYAGVSDNGESKVIYVSSEYLIFETEVLSSNMTVVLTMQSLAVWYIRELMTC